MPGRRSQRTLEGERMRAEIVALRRQRLSQREIAERLGVSQQRVSQLYRQALAEISVQQVDEHRAEELAFYDHAVSRLLVIAEDEDVSPRARVEAWNSIRGWAERKAKLLGLDAPTKHEVVTLDAIDAEIARLEAELSVASAPK